MGVIDAPAAAGHLLRRAVRITLLDPDDRVLLARYAGRRGPTWILVGGTVDPGETDLDALRREVTEETGCPAYELGPELLRMRTLSTGWHGGPLDSRHRVWLGRCAAFEPAPTALTAEERAMDVVVRWWTPAELASSDAVYEPDIPALVGRLLRDGPPGVPEEVELRL